MRSLRKQLKIIEDFEKQSAKVNLVVGGKRIPQNYYKCVGCGNCVNADLNRGKCEMCSCSKWIACTD